MYRLTLKLTPFYLSAIIGLVLGILNPLVTVQVAAAEIPVISQGNNEILTYHHAPMGLTFSYPSDWKLETLSSVPLLPEPEYLPEGYSAEEDMEGRRTFGNKITLYPPGWEKELLDLVYIFISSNRVSASGDLLTVVTLQNELASVDSGLAKSTDVIVTQPTFDGVDAVVGVSAKNADMHSESIWLAKDGLIFGIATASQHPTIIASIHEIAATFQFDGTTSTLFEKYKKYTTDADTLRIAIEASRPKPAPDCDIVCQDQIYLEQGPSLNYSTQSTTQSMQQSTVPFAALTVSGNQKALPSSWPSPVIPPTLSSPAWPGNCGSPLHIGNSEYSLDIGALQYTNVYAVADGIVTKRMEWDNTTQGYGNHVVVKSSPINIAAETREYYHAYAHLDSIAPGIVLNQWVVRGAKIGEVGSTGANAVHLHFHIRDGANNPVDATPLLGFSPTLQYPGAPYVNVVCGSVDYAEKSPVIIESVGFTARLHQGSNGYSWICINPAGATVECYMYGNPNAGGGFDPLDTNVAPQLNYGNVYVYQFQNPTTYYVWTCGHAASGGDDTIYVQAGNRKVLIAQSPWTWLHQQFPSGQPTLSLNAGAQTIRVWMREDGARFGRILLARSPTYNPNGIIKCGGY